MISKKEERENAVRQSKTKMILDAAIEVFVQLGYHATRLEDIAEAAGFSKTALYYYFKDKEEIFLNLCLREHERLITEVGKNLSTCTCFIDSLTTMIRTIFVEAGERFSFMLAFSNPDPGKAINPADFLKHQDTLSKFKQCRIDMERVFRKNVERGIQSGEINTPLPVEEIANLIESLIKGIFMRWWQKGKKGDIEEEIKSIITFVRSGLNIKDVNCSSTTAVHSGETYEQ